MMKNSTIRFLIVVFAVAVLCSSAAYADPLPLRLLIQTGAGTGVVVTDNQVPEDINPLAGALTYSGSLGGGYLVNVTTGLSKPILGGVNNYAELDLNSVNVVMNGPGSLLIILEDNSFSLGPDGTMSFSGSIGGTLNAGAGSTITAQTWLNTGNAVPSLTLPSTTNLNSIAPAGSISAWSTPQVFGPGAFSSTGFGEFTKSGDYSMFSAVLINFTGAGSVSFDLNSQVTPEPTSLLLLGSGLAGLGLLGRMKKQSASKSLNS